MLSSSNEVLRCNLKPVERDACDVREMRQSTAAREVENRVPRNLEVRCWLQCLIEMGTRGVVDSGKVRTEP